MSTILKGAKRASLASRRHLMAVTRLRMALSFAKDELPILTGFASLAPPHRPRTVEVTQELSALQAAYSNQSK
ncbi:hypothetical protein [Pandoraea communis]|uniref:hypothetical protein n=1 Tax=Pandoraea communis TaxID=2508297 RepID=UPI0025A5F93B|nr:hypothetical protein [Pandoraea communis]MDM8356562.1 hypothetical protein [Pandoraea communis]